LLPRGILALEVKFLCPDCNVKLQIDARLEGQTVNCPKCQHEICVPHWSAAPVTRKHQQPATPTAELSEAEIEFLSGPTEMKATHAATA
jgi:peptide subunit release factor 1 (eRF1)